MAPNSRFMPSSLSNHKIDLHHISSAKPMQNGYVENSNGKKRNEPLNEALFLRLDYALQTIAEWVNDYDTARLHSV